MSYELKEVWEDIRSLNRTDWILVFVYFVFIAGIFVFGFGFEPRTATAISLIFLGYIYLARKGLWKKKNG